MSVLQPIKGKRAMVLFPLIAFARRMAFRIQSATRDVKGRPKTASRRFAERLSRGWEVL